MAENKKFDTFDLRVTEATEFLVAHGDGEVVFTTDDKGHYTPKDELELWAMQQLGARPVTKGATDASK